MKLNNPFFLLFAGTLGVVSFAASSQSVDFTIYGEIQSITCTPSISVVGGSGGQWAGNALILPKVLVEDLDVVGKTAKQIPLTFELSNCAQPSSVTHVWVYFTSPQVVDGRIVPTTGNDKLHFEIIDSTGKVDVSSTGTPAGSQPGITQGAAVAFTGSYPFRAASKTYSFHYYANEALTNADAGTTMSASATYTLVYY